MKTYLTPPELGPAEGQLGLDLVPGAVSDGLGAVRTPVGTLGFATSKDAWMPDVAQKLDQRHVDLLVQPEWFVGNGVRPEGMWTPTCCAIPRCAPPWCPSSWGTCSTSRPTTSSSWR